MSDIKNMTVQQLTATNRIGTEETGSDSNAVDDNACVVCFKNVEIYSIGECDHPVCYECSTRMRVLCQQNECPICRQVLSKVIFTCDKLPYRELEAKNCSQHYSKKYKIGFHNDKIRRAFFNLLDHPCSKCNVPPYRKFQDLKDHVRREHDLHFCDLCVEHLKIFTCERRCYTQTELGLHRTKGDVDNRSHRGHPLCEYCKKRFLDRDELFRHMRREHYFCHFCDADGCNEFYRDYDALAEHFRQEHYLCEEGKCATERFIGAFRTEIDYKAHIASTHGKSLNKQQAKQTRTLQLEITLGPRGRSGQTEQGIASVRSRGNEEAVVDSHDAALSMIPQQSQRSITIDARNEQEFPSLGGAATGTSVSLIRPPPQSMRNRSAISGLARTKENFPALGGGGGGGGSVNAQKLPSQQTPPISSVIRNSPSAATGAISRTTTPPVNNNTSGVLLHVSNRPTPNNSTNVTAKKPSTADFPALPTGKSKKNGRSKDEDELPPPAPIPTTKVSAKHRSLVDDYVSVANPSNFQKIQMVQKEEMEMKAKKIAEMNNAPKLTSQDFPSLSGSGGGKQLASAANTWLKQPSDKRQRELENRKAKVAPPPLLPKDNRNSSSAGKSTSTSTVNNNTSMKEALSKKEKKNKDKKSASDLNVATQDKSTNNAKSKEKNNNSNSNNNENSTTLFNVEESPTGLFNGNDATTNAALMRPPPGFSNQSNSVKPPPGFHSNVTVNSIAKSPNNLTFTNSLGESYSIVPTHTYMQPPEAVTRSQKLVNHFKDSLRNNESLLEFRLISQYFLEGKCKAPAYFEHCQAAFKNSFDDVFPEHLALLPDINKQQDLYLVYTQHLNSMTPNRRKTLPKLEVCPKCKQVLQGFDFESHRSIHEHLVNFPTLSGKANKTGASNRK